MSTTMTHRTLKTRYPSTPEGREELYHSKQFTILEQLDALKAAVLARETQAAAKDYHWGFLGDLDRIQTQLDEMLTPN